jgi:hypothetical protein
MESSYYKPRPLVGVRAIDIGGVEKSDAEIERVPDQVDARRLVSAAAEIEIRKAHTTRPDYGDRKILAFDFT